MLVGERHDLCRCGDYRYQHCGECGQCLICGASYQPWDSCMKFRLNLEAHDDPAP